MAISSTNSTIYKERLCFYTGTSDSTLTAKLVQQKLESTLDFDRRKSLAPFYPIVRSIVHTFTNQIYKIKPEREIEQFQLEKIIFHSQNLSEVDINDFEEDVLKYFLILGRVFVLETYDTKDDMAIVYLLLPTTCEKKIVSNKITFQGEVDRGNSNKVQFYCDEQDDGSFITQVGDNEYITENNPLYDLYIDLNQDDLADSCFTDAIALVKVIYNLDSILTAAMHRGYINPILLPMDPHLYGFYQDNFPSYEDPTTGKVVLDIRPNEIMPVSGDAKPEVLNIDAGFITLLREIIKDMKDEVREVTNSKIRQIFAESMVSKQFTAHETVIPLLYFASFMEDFSSNLLKSITGQPVTVSYNKSFNIFDTKLITEQIGYLLEKGIVRNEKVKDDLEELLVRVNTNDVISQKEQAEILASYNVIEDMINANKNQTNLKEGNDNARNENKE